MTARPKGTKTRYPGVTRLSDGRYLLRWKGRDPKTDREREFNRIVEASSARDAAREREDLRAEQSGGTNGAARMRLADYSTSWLAGKRKTLKASTLDRYTRTVAHHIMPALGDYYLDAVTHEDIVKWRDAQTDAPSSVNGWLRVLKTICADAAAARIIPFSPAARVVALPETGGYDDEAPNCLTAAELALFLETAQRVVPRRWYPLFAVLAFTAMRVGEATALKWSDVIEGEGDALGIIHVRRAHWRGRVGTPKTKKSARSIPLPRELAAILSDHRRALVARQAEELTPAKLRGVQRGLEAGWVFPNDKGGPTAAQVVRKPLRRVLRALEGGDVDHLTVHGLRRTMNNLLRQVATGDVVRSVTGHVTERMTELYSHIRRDEKATAVAQVVSLVRRPPTQSMEVGVLVGVGGSKS